MKNLFLMSLFGLFMIAAMSGQSVTSISLVSPAYASDDADLDAGDGLNCPDGIITCYSADGIEYIDVNNLEATAAGSEGEGDDGESLVSIVSPSHFRSL